MNLSALSLLALATYVLADNGFASTCSNFQLSGASLTATCGNGHGGYNTGSINLNSGCVNNNNGRLYCGGGGYASSCFSCSLSGSSLSCSCPQNGGLDVPAKIDLNGCVGNQGGNLHC